MSSNCVCKKCAKPVCFNDEIFFGDDHYYHTSCANCHLCTKNLTYTIAKKCGDKLYCVICYQLNLLQICKTSTESSNKLSCPSEIIDKQQINLETFSLIWLDADVNKTKENIRSQLKLREAINFIQIFDQADQCEANIRNIQHEKVVLIVSGRLGREVVPHLHDLPQLISIYVYCYDIVANKQWADQYVKVRGVFDALDDVVENITKDQKIREKVENLAAAAITIFNRSDKEYTHKNLKSENSSFMWFQLLIETLLAMEKHFDDAKEELIEICKKQYQDNEAELNIIDEFEKSYDGTNAIWWYTRESCFYRILNKALRVQNVDMLFAFRFVIKDLFDELTKEHEQQFRQSSSDDKVLRVFRGQAISTEEFRKMRRSIGEFISINSFFSTSKNRERALAFAQNAMVSKGIEKVLFDIEVDVDLTTKPFADITKLSYAEEEEEILFMLGAIFRIKTVTYCNQESIWIAELSLCSDNDHHLRDLLNYYKKKINRSLTDTVVLGDILFKMGEFDKAKQFYNRILTKSSINNGRSMANCYFGLGNIAIEQDDYSTALTDHIKAMELRKKLDDNSRDLASSYNQIGESYQRLQKFDEALEYTSLALTMRQQCLGNDDVDLAQSYRQIGYIYYRLGKNDLALANLFEAIKIYTKVLPENHPDVAENFNYIGYVYEAMKKFDLALYHFLEALKIHRQSLPENHSDLGVTLQAIGVFFYQYGDLSSALQYFQEALTIFRKSLPPTHGYIRDVEVKIDEIKTLSFKKT